MYQIILVGTDETVDRQLPKNIISIHRTQNQTELAEIYSAADLFVNTSREENYPTVNMEALASAMPVITFDTGESPKIIDETHGAVVCKGNIDELVKEIMRICANKPYSTLACLRQARNFDKRKKFEEYVDIYRLI